ncbi:MAG: hypothetical protein NXI30_25550 [bacterium]|nr:hypothetical protein [bacterium]
MLSGFNTNFRYRGVLFHVQTEDSGLGNPHVITHLFHGGNIMASEKRDYSEFLGEKEGDALEDAIRKLMEGLHKSMLKQLSRGEHDAAIEQRMGPDVFQIDATDATAEPPTLTEEERPPAPPQERAQVPPVAEPTFVEPHALTEPQAPIDPPPAAASEQTDGGSRLSRVFGDRVVSEKPLDEVVLDYLVENARKRKRTTKS